MVYRIWYIMIGELEAQISCRFPKTQASGSRRSSIDLIQNRMARGFIKKTQKTPDEGLDLVRRNKNKHQRGLH